MKKLQVIVVSNFEDKKTQVVIDEYASRLFDLKYYISGQKGCNIARNFGIRFASCDILYFLDDDCILANKNQLNEIIKYHNEYQHAIGIGGGYSERADRQNVSEIIYSKNQSLWLKRSANEKKETHHLIGGNASYKKRIFKKGYNYNSAIVFGGSEVSLTKKLYDDGYKLLYFEELSVVHDLKVSLFSLLKKGFMQGKGKYLNCNKEEAKKFAGFIKNIIPSEQNTIELQSKYQQCIWYMFHFMFKMGFHWSMYCAEKNLSNKNIFGFIGALSYFKKHFTYVSKNKNEQSIKVVRYSANKFRHKLNKVYYFFRRYVRLFFIKAYWYAHAVYSVIIRRIFLNKIIFKLSRKLARKSKMYFKIVKVYTGVYKLRLRTFSYYAFKKPYRKVRTLSKVYKLRLRTSMYKNIYKPLRSIFRPLLVKLYWLPNEVRKMAFKLSRQFYTYILIKLFWLPNEIRKIAYKYGRMFYVYVLVKLFWLPNEIRKFVYKYGRMFYVYVLVKLFWLPNEIRKFAYKYGRMFYVYVLVKLFWLPNEIRKFVYKYGRMFYVYVLIKLYWLPNEIRKLCYRYGRFFYGHGRGLAIRVGVKAYWLVRNFISSTYWMIKNVNLILKQNALLVFFKVQPILLKPYYMMNYQINKRLKRKVSRGKS